jgi:hypothetical protein
LPGDTSGSGRGILGVVQSFLFLIDPFEPLKFGASRLLLLILLSVYFVG